MPFSLDCETDGKGRGQMECAAYRTDVLLQIFLFCGTGDWHYPGLSGKMQGDCNPSRQFDHGHPETFFRMAFCEMQS